MTENNWLEIIPEEVIYLITRLNSHGYDAWLVGGCVRDMSLGIMPDDYDIATSALPSEVAALFERSLDTGVKHGTVTVILAGKPYEVTTFRSEGPYSDGRRPDSVRYESEIIHDLARRDFTINSMAWHPKRELLDPFGGRQDLQARILRCVGDAEARMTEDALRQLRAVRFALNYNLCPDDELLQAIKLHYEKVDLLSAERIQTELTRTGWATYGSVLRLFCGTGLIARAFQKILNYQVDDELLCQLLAVLIQPFWQKEQIWTVYILACLFAKTGENTLIDIAVPVSEDKSDIDYREDINESVVLRFQLEEWHKMSKGLTFASVSCLQQVLVERTRLSLGLSRRTQAMLIMIRLRLLLVAAERRQNGAGSDSDRAIISELRLKMILRAAARQSHLDQWQLLDVCRQAWSILRIFSADDALRNELKVEDEVLQQWHSFPDEYRISPTQLPIRGNDLVFARLRDKRRIGVYLERLLSKQLRMNRALEADEAVCLLEEWLSKETVNESKMSY